jgi:hypothetical protein
MQRGQATAIAAQNASDLSEQSWYMNLQAATSLGSPTKDSQARPNLPRLSDWISESNSESSSL